MIRFVSPKILVHSCLGRLELSCRAGGGEGMGAIEKTVEAVVEKVGAMCQLVVICGRNKKLADRLKSR